MAPKLKQTLITRPIRAVSTASWLYPLKGIYYFLTHPFLYPLLRARLLPCTLLSLFVLSSLFVWTYLPQVAFLAVVFRQGHSAWVNGTVLVLGEGAAIIAILFEAFLVDEAQVDIFDAVLVSEGHDDLVRTMRPVEDALLSGEYANPVRRLGRPTKASVYAPFSLRQIVEFVVLLPLNFVPFVGVPLFLLLTGYRAGPFQHWRYFKLRALSRSERDAEVGKRRPSYTWFGTVALLLQLVPVLSMLFLLTTAAGAALWAARLEEEKMMAEERVQSGTQEYAGDPV
ncbi:hypothetical protein LTR16_004363 [Cryomyces antarcticus]|uniref:Uncharacterized protein n=1 Tax=Cryomyces antarcticus TaxID=329879 RepID=A0ABR0LYR6_9PEZI|nr:hypothetical protein LTR60_005490 [Cryomyces antarcticus]KAK5008584.1 hypothetical protein LTR39_005134 [Cryomyces antarcticus]KAK5255945.1 hypothetical protein LTR16_004363 [Cryomyces antarcticus]